MALSLSNFLYPLLSLIVLLPQLASAKTAEYDFHVGWVTTNPDNSFERTTIGINGQWPIPTINVTKGDRVIVRVHNELGNQTTSLHFHGIYQNGTSYMDGVVGTTQCAIPAGSTFTYNFTINQPGTYWYHSHVRGQFPDGLRGPLIVHDPDSPYLGKYDKEMVMTLSDWYHDQMPGLISSFLSVTNPTGAEPVPDAALMNDSQNVTFSIEAGKTYMFRIINMGAFAAQYIWFEDHEMEIVEVDGVWTEPQKAKMIYVTVAQRYSVLIKAKKSGNANFAIVGSMDETLFDTVPATLNPNVTGYLVYDSNKPMPKPSTVDSWEAAYDDFDLVPYDREGIWENPSQTVHMTMKMANLANGANYAEINNSTFQSQKVPSLYSTVSSGSMADNPEIYSSHSNPFVLKHNQVIEIIMNNDDPGKHPFHLHGHNFQAVTRSAAGVGYYNPAHAPPMPKIPMRRDTFHVRPNGFFILRFRSDNPGTWLYHCHIEWHVVSGLVATFVEAPMEIQKSQVIPQDHIEACKTLTEPYKGNAAGNTEDLLDLSGQNVPPGPLPSGFTARGIVALVFSCIAAVLGMGAVAWYGAAPIGKKDERSMERQIEQEGNKAKS